MLSLALGVVSRGGGHGAREALGEHFGNEFRFSLEISTGHAYVHHRRSMHKNRRRHKDNHRHARTRTVVRHDAVSRWDARTRQRGSCGTAISHFRDRRARPRAQQRFRCSAPTGHPTAICICADMHVCMYVVFCTDGRACVIKLSQTHTRICARCNAEAQIA